MRQFIFPFLFVVFLFSSDARPPLMVDVVNLDSEIIGAGFTQQPGIKYAIQTIAFQDPPGSPKGSVVIMTFVMPADSLKRRSPGGLRNLLYVIE